MDHSAHESHRQLHKSSCKRPTAFHANSESIQHESAESTNALKRVPSLHSPSHLIRRPKQISVTYDERFQSERKSISGLIAAFWFFVGMQTDFSDDAEYFGRKFFPRIIFRVEATLICEIFNHSKK
jgi:hypothetical protein